MNDCYSTTGYGTKTSLRIEPTASSFFALPYHQLERIDFNSAREADTMILSFITCTVRVTGKKLRLVAEYVAKQEAEAIRVAPKNSSPPEENSARIDKIEIVEKESVVDISSRQ